MVVKVLQMQTGEQIITGIIEMTNEKEEGVCFQITHPYILNLIPSTEFTPEGQPSSFNVNYTRWMACSSESQFRIPYSAVIAIGEPDAQIMETYMNKFGELFNDTDTLQPSDSTDIVEEPDVSDSGSGGEGGES